MYRSAYSNKFDWFTNMSMVVVSISLAVYAIYIAGGNVAMTQPLPPLIIAFFVLAGVLFLMAIYNGIRMLMAPKDTRLDTLIEKVATTDDIATLEKKIDSLIEHQIDKEATNNLVAAIKELTDELKKK